MGDEALMDGAPIIRTHLTRRDPFRLDVSNEREHSTDVCNRRDGEQFAHLRGDTKDRRRGFPPCNRPQDRELTIRGAVLVPVPSEESEYRARFKVMDPLAATDTRTVNGNSEAQRHMPDLWNAYRRDARQLHIHSQGRPASWPLVDAVPAAGDCVGGFGRRRSKVKMSCPAGPRISCK